MLTQIHSKTEDFNWEMLKNSIVFFVTAIRLLIKSATLFLQIMLWACKNAFYFCVGILMVLSLPHNGYTLLGFGIGVAIAFCINLFLKNFSLFYRQMTFSLIGFSTGLIVSIKMGSSSIMLTFITLTLTGLCLSQAHHES